MYRKASRYTALSSEDLEVHVFNWIHEHGFWPKALQIHGCLCQKILFMLLYMQKKIPFLRRKLGIVFQDFKLLSDRSISKNLEFVLKATDWKDKNKIQDRIKEVLEKVKLSDAI